MLLQTVLLTTLILFAVHLFNRLKWNRSGKTGRYLIVFIDSSNLKALSNELRRYICPTLVESNIFGYNTSDTHDRSS